MLPRPAGAPEYRGRDPGHRGVPGRAGDRRLRRPGLRLRTRRTSPAEVSRPRGRRPLALTRDELDRVVDVVEKTGNDRLMVGFNRRFAPLLDQMKTRFGQPVGGSVARYLVNAGRLDSDSWYSNEELEGSRFTGEGGHF